MNQKLINLIKEGNILLPKLLLTNYKKLKITELELILLIYLIGNNDFDPEKISKDLDLEIPKVLTLINSLDKKNILKIKQVDTNGIKEEKVNLDNLYEQLLLKFIEKEEVNQSNIFDSFEKEFARTLSPTEYEIISAWMESGFTEEIIIAALKEAIYNGVKNLRYIDRILSNWKTKGVKTVDDVKKLTNVKNQKQTKKEVFDYDWLNE